jgi:hypothetical protein
MPAKRRQPKPPDPFAARAGETSADVYLRLHCKARKEGVIVERNQHGIPYALSSDGQTWYDFTCADSGEYIACSCPYGANEPGRICKHLTTLYPPKPYKDPCPRCSGKLLYWHDPSGHAVRCQHCHYCEAWQDKAVKQDPDEAYRELYQLERVEA